MREPSSFFSSRRLIPIYLLVTSSGPHHTVPVNKSSSSSSCPVSSPLRAPSFPLSLSLSYPHPLLGLTNERSEKKGMKEEEEEEAKGPPGRRGAMGVGIKALPAPPLPPPPLADLGWDLQIGVLREYSCLVNVSPPIPSLSCFSSWGGGGGGGVGDDEVGKAPL